MCSKAKSAEELLNLGHHYPHNSATPAAAAAQGKQPNVLQSYSRRNIRLAGVWRGGGNGGLTLKGGGRDNKKEEKAFLSLSLLFFQTNGRGENLYFLSFQPPSSVCVCVWSSFLGRRENGRGKNGGSFKIRFVAFPAPPPPPLLFSPGEKKLPYCPEDEVFTGVGKAVEEIQGDLKVFDNKKESYKKNVHSPDWKVHKMLMEKVARKRPVVLFFAAPWKGRNDKNGLFFQETKYKPQQKKEEEKWEGRVLLPVFFTLSLSPSPLPTHFSKRRRWEEETEFSASEEGGEGGKGEGKQSYLKKK